MNVPAGYVELAGPGHGGFALRDDAEWIRSVLSATETLHGWAARVPGVETLTGRESVYAFPAPSGSPDLEYVSRHYRRGGVFAPVLQDRFVPVGAPRPLVELHASEAARARGVPTPRVVAGLVYPGPGFYRADLVTERVRGRNLASVLSDADGDADFVELLTRVGRLVIQLEAAGLRHPDLNVRNILVEPGPDGALHVLDLDRARVGDHRSGGGAMRARLRRSLRKLERQGVALSAASWRALDRGFRDRGFRGGAP